MYQDSGYGANWQPATNNARRIDPYTRSCVIYVCFFTIGFVLIIIIVLSLIPLYISHNSSATNNYTQVLRVYINGYTLQLHSPSDNFDSKTILSESNNRQALQAALTSMIQNDSILAGSVIEIATTSLTSQRNRRQISSLLNITFDLYLTSNNSCVSSTCLNQFRVHVINQLSHTDRTTSLVRYEQLTTNASQTYWFQYQFPNIIKPQVSIVNIDPKTISSLLESLITINKNFNFPSSNELITSTSNLIG